MQEGLIVYLVGTQELPESFDLLENCRELGLTPHRVELVSQDQGFFSVEDAWHYLVTHGMGSVSLMVAQRQGHRLAPVYPPVRLSG